MVMQDIRVPNPPPPSQAAAEPSTSVDASSHAPGPQQQSSMLQSAFSTNNYNISETHETDNSAPLITPVLSRPPQTVSGGLLSTTKGISEDPQTGLNRTWFNSQAPVNDTSAWNNPTPLFFDIPGSTSSTPSHSMAVLRNRTVGFPALAPAPRKPEPIAKSLAEGFQVPGVQLKPNAVPPASASLTPISNDKSNVSQLATDMQTQPIPFPSSDPLITPTTISKQLNPMNLSSSSPHKTSTTRSRKRKNKRKRARNSDDEIKADNNSSSNDESDDLFPVARQTKSGRQVNRPKYFTASPEPKQSARQNSSPLGTATTPVSGTPAKRRRKVYRKNGKDINITCQYCQRSNSPATNLIVFCDECNDAWHQYCHDPPIGKELIDDKEAEWFCKECRPETSGQRPVILRLRLPKKGTTAPVEMPSVPLVCGEKFTTDEQRGYLSSLSHAALVDMLVTLSKTNPTLPMFPEDLKDLRQSKFAIAPSNIKEGPSLISQSALAEAEASKEIKLGDQSTETLAESSNSKKNEDEDSDDSGSEYEVEEHRLYPRSGNGFRLPLEDGFEMLLDDTACPTFSHALHTYPQSRPLSDATIAIKAAG